MNRLDLAIFDGTSRLNLPTERAEDVEVVTGPRGLQSVSASLPLNTYQAFDLYRRLGTARAVVTADGFPVADARIEDPAISDTGARITTLGPWRELSDIPYTGLWSVSGTEGWAPLSNQVIGGGVTSRAPEMYEFQIDEAIQIALTKGSSYANGVDVGSVYFRIPSLSSQSVTGLQLRLRLLVPTNWQFRMIVFPGETFTGGSAAFTVTSAGVLIDRAYLVSGTTAGILEMQVINLTGGASAPAGESGDWYAIISDIRLVSAVSQAVSTTFTANRAAGASVTATVGSTTGMYAGMALVINTAASASEIVTVESITSSTQFVATFVNAYVIGNPVQGHKVRPDQIVAAMPAYITATNTGGVLSSSTALVQACDRDLLNAVWEDTTPADIVAELAERGSSTTRFETQVWADGFLRFHPVGTYAREWAVDAADLTIEQTIDGLVNSVYPRYQDASGRTLRGSAQVDSISVFRYGLTRRGTVDTDTTNATIAGLVAATALDQSSDPIPRAGITVTRVYSITGAEAPLSDVRAGDTVTIRNLPPQAGAVINRIQVFRIAETRLQDNGGRLVLVPESPLPDIEHQQAAIVGAAEVAASMSATPAATPQTILVPQQARRRNPTKRKPDIPTTSR